MLTDAEGNPVVDSSAQLYVRVRARGVTWGFPGAFGSTFSLTNLPAGDDYFLEVEDLSGRYATTFSGGTPFEADAEEFDASASGIEIRMPLAAQVSGRLDVTTQGWRNDLVIEAWRIDEADGKLRLVLTMWDNPMANPGFNLALFPGAYVFRAHSGGERDLSAEFFRETEYLDEAEVVNLAPGEQFSGLDFLLSEFTWKVYRSSGPDRYATSVAATQAFDPDLPVLYIASGENWPDALSAGPAAAARGGALLLTQPGALPAVVAREIERLAPREVVVAGGAGSVSPTVFEQVRSIVPTTRRVGGADRYETSRNLVIDAFVEKPYDNVFVATGRDFPDALSAGAVAGRRHEPVLLIDGERAGIDAATSAVLSDLDVSAAFLAGGTGAITASIETELVESGMVARVARAAGIDRYDTSAKIADAFPASSLNDLVFIAQGTGFADALAGGPVAAAVGAPLRLSRPECIPEGTLYAMWIQSEDEVVLLGGEGALSEDVASLTVCG
ncbi:cell wall-binding repeat-containing protein [Agromyces subbeticus]|uniref:cell wall-binding repeat-containing protein n=1 Tax=Agromyces subbeticus TaxID=293890 RepID=UPI0003B33D5D|nr:cell wall-binding repeat-containing protein [Agromyces subbeticus]